MDVRAIVDALKRIGYQGFVSIEQDKHPGDMRATCARYVKTMRDYVGEA
jgi:sugar phosphate isomerase/epimerase